MNTKKNKITSILNAEDVLSIGDMAISLYNKGYYGFPESKGVRLNGFEALHLFELGRIEIFQKENILDGDHILKYFSCIISNFMLRYMVYKDLRNRGYIINVGKGSAFFFRLYDRDTKPKYGGAKYYIKPLQEGGSIKIKELEVLTDIAKKSNKELIFGMVDAIGDVSYLKVEELIPNDISEKKKF